MNPEDHEEQDPRKASPEIPFGETDLGSGIGCALMILASLLGIAAIILALKP